jgi:alpha-L-rhamnosidase
MKRYITILLLLLIGGTVSAQVSLQNLRCEMQTDPMGIDVLHPRLSWEIASVQGNVRQTAYQLIIASSREKLEKGIGDLWNSGKVNSETSVNVVYQGKPLNSRVLCFWKVKVVTSKGESSWCNPAYFSMGLLHQTDWQAKWIGYDKASSWDSVTHWSRLSARYFRKPFQVAAPVKRATVYMVGLGLYELYLNGNKLSQDVLTPSPTDYRKTVLYNTYDVTQQLKTGNNVIAAIVSNGRFFTMRQNYKPQKINTFGFPKMLLQLEIEYADGTRKTVVSDGTWKLNVDGPVRTANEYDGEEYDARKEQPGWNNISFNETTWMQPQLVEAPAGKLKAQLNERMKVMKVIRPVSIKNAGNGKWILDMGQNFSGWLQLKVQGTSGQKVVLRFAESLQKNGSLYVANLRDAKATDVYTLKGGPVETWHPSFMYHGFRYVEITDYPGIPELDNFEGQVVFDGLPTIGSFESSDTVINAIYRNAWWGIASDYKGMPVDCPQRNERQPWLGDRTTGSMGESFLFANQTLYAKWLDDIEDSQKPDGAIPDVAPAFWNYYSDNVTWPGTYLFVANMLYHQFGDRQAILKHYPSMKKWMLYMQSKYMVNDIVTKDKYGDWCVPPESLELIHARDTTLITNGQLIATAYYYKLLQYMQQFAHMGQKEEDVKVFSALAEKVKAAFNKKFFNEQKSSYDNNTITANLLPLYFGMVPGNFQQAVFDNIVCKMDDNHLHLSTGVIGTQWIMRGLSRFQRPDIAYTLASNTTYPSWGYMVKNGASTIWELWNGNTANPQMNSQNHVMLLGDLLIWLNENLAGIKSDDTAVAFKKIIMKPELINGLDFVRASYHSPYGNIQSDWNRTGNNFTWQIKVRPAAEKEGVRFKGMDGKYAVFETGSGNYSFSSVE